MHLRSYKSIFLPAARGWSEHAASRLSAALSFYAMLSLAPLLVIAVTVATLVLDQGTIRETLYQEADQSLGKGAADLLVSLVDHASKPTTSVFATIAAVMIAVYAASGLFNQVIVSVEAIWDIEHEELHLVKQILLARLKSLVIMIGFILLFVAWLVADAVLGWLSRTQGEFAGWPAVSLLASVVFATLVFALTFRSVPRQRVQWQDVWPGAIVTGLGFSLAKAALSLYFSYSGIATAYGSAGALLVILLWIYYSSQIFFYGIEVTRVVATKRLAKLKPHPDPS